MKMTIEEIKNKLSYILEYHEPQKIKLSKEAKELDRLEQARKSAKRLIERINNL